MAKPLALVIAFGYTVALAIISLVPFTSTPDYVPQISDKIIHFLLYALLCFVWFLALRNYISSKVKPIVWASCIAVIFGIIIEELQGSITETRTSDFKDVVANFLGIAFTVLVLCFRNKIEVKK